MIETVYGQTRKQQPAAQLRDAIEGMALNGTLYIGYPVLASADEKVDVDALLLSEEHGLVAFLLTDGLPPPSHDMDTWGRLRDSQDRIYFALESNLSRHEGLRSGRQLGAEIHTVTLFPSPVTAPTGIEGVFCDMTTLPSVVRGFAQVPEQFLKPLNAALQRVTTIKPVKKRESVKKDESRGAILKKLEKEIANLDQWQKRAAIESVDGPQRIRGLAGSGKTVVLALKAAYLHAQHPTWNIAVTFHSRALYQQFTDLIRRFCFEHLNDEPDWERLNVIHSWGGSGRGGIYTQVAQHASVDPKDFLYGKTRYGMAGAFRGVCSELLAATASAGNVEPLYDAVLIDEAQDLPPAFFQLVYRFTRDPKRIVWAYDELQTLSEASMPSTSELFGEDVNGHPHVSLANVHGLPRQDVILPVCYRNTPWALTLAHALGFGIFRQTGGLVQHFDEPSWWEDIGYRVVEGELSEGRRVVLERRPNSYPGYFSDLLRPDDAVISVGFENELEQAEWIARSIAINLSEDELEPDDILIVLPEAYTARRASADVIEALSRHGIEAHLVGVTSSPDQVFSKQSVAIANIYRSKGNEAPMVYVLNSQYCFSGHELLTLRNILFTAITRSRAWLRLCGWGPDMAALEAEIDNVRQHNFRLDFTIPTGRQLQEMRQINRERTADERIKLRRAELGLREFLKTVHEGELSLVNLPLELRTALGKMLKKQEPGADDDA